MAKILYALREKGDTEEYHLFECRPIGEKCSCLKTSICGKMNYNEQVKTIFTCNEEDSARIKIARIGRSVCGICASSLYSTYN